MKPTSPPPPETLSDEDIRRLHSRFWNSMDGELGYYVGFARAAYAAGYEARGKRDAEIARTEVPGDMCGDLIAAAIESSSGERPTEREAFEAQYLNQPTGERRDKCRTCGSNNPNRLAGECLRRYADATLPLYDKFHHSLRRRAPR